MKGIGTIKEGADKPGCLRAKGRPLNSIDKSNQKRSETVPRFKEKADKIKAVIEDLAENRHVMHTWSMEFFQ